MHAIIGLLNWTIIIADDGAVHLIKCSLIGRRAIARTLHPASDYNNFMHMIKKDSDDAEFNLFVCRMKKKELAAAAINANGRKRMQ